MVPRVNLADPDVEPTDAELQALSRAARDTAIARHNEAQARFRADITELLRASRAAAEKGIPGSVIARAMYVRECQVLKA